MTDKEIYKKQIDKIYANMELNGQKPIDVYGDLYDITKKVYGSERNLIVNRKCKDSIIGYCVLEGFDKTKFKVGCRYCNKSVY